MAFILRSVLLACLVCLSQSQLQIPKQELGFVYKGGEPCAPVKLAAYMDLTCPDSQMAYPTLLEVADHFGKGVVQLRVHLFSLPYHRNSHTISKGAHVISQYKNATVFEWFKKIYDNIDHLTTSATADKTDLQVLDILVDIAERVAGIPGDTFKAGVANTEIDVLTRLGWKYGCTRGVYGTPMFTVNDVFVQAEASWTLDQWINLIKPLLVGQGLQQLGC